MNQERERLKQRLRILQQRYTRSLPERIQKIEGYWQQVIQGEEKQQALEQLLHAVHNLTGSGSIYGHPRISELAGQLEPVLAEIQSTSQLPPELQEKVEKSLHALRMAAEPPP